MSQQGPVILVSAAGRPAFATVLGEAGIFPVIDAGWADASRAVEQLQPAAVVAAMSGNIEPRLSVCARQIADNQPYLPLIAVDPQPLLPENAIPFAQRGNSSDRMMARLRSALRVRTLHSTVMRRLDDDPPSSMAGSIADPVRDATVLLIGRGSTYPTLSVSLGERMGGGGPLILETA